MKHNDLNTASRFQHRITLYHNDVCIDSVSYTGTNICQHLQRLTLTLQVSTTQNKQSI